MTQPVGADLAWPGAPPWRALGAGGLFCAVLAMAAGLLAQQQGGPALLYALLLGMAFHFLHDDVRLAAGIEFCTRFVLRLGVALLGARITLAQVAELGWPTALAVLACVFSTIAAGTWLARRLGLSTAQGLLSGGATAICGASAALAIAAVLPRGREQDRFTLLVVLMVTALSTLAMLVYPLLAQALQLTPAMAGLFLGGAIHDVAQVVAAGQLMGPATADVAIVVKLFRVTLLALVVVVVSAACRAPAGAAAGRRPALLPWFLCAFVALLLLHSLLGIPPALQTAAAEVSRACLVVAIAALGVKTCWTALWRSGWRPLVLLLAETLWLAAALLLVLLVQRSA